MSAFDRPRLADGPPTVATFDTPRRPDGTAQPPPSHGPHLQTPGTVVEDLNGVHRGFWHVQYSAFRGDFIAYPVWVHAGTPGRPVVAADVPRLLELMADVERAAGIVRSPVTL